MDLYDKKILKLIIENCRYPISDIAKAVGLSKDSVRYRINKLEKDKIVTEYSLLFDMRTAGYFVTHLFLKLKNITKKDESYIISQLSKHKNITFISSQIGVYDMQVIFHTQNVFHRNKIEKEILEILGSKVKDSVIINHVQDYNFSFIFSDIDVNINVKEKTDTSFSKLIKKNEGTNCKEPTSQSFDLIDKKVIKELVQNPKEKLRVIGQNVGMSAEGVKKRIKKIIEKGGIYKFTLYPNHIKLGLFNYMLLFKIQILPDDVNKRLQQFLLKSNFILYATKTDGTYNLIIYILAKNPLEFQTRFETLREIIDEYIIHYDLSILTDIHKFAMLCDEFFEE